ncbi:MAG: helix-turn-helix domain-containing protein [Allorhizobium sp.]
MVQKHLIDTAWFRHQLERKKKTASDLALFLGVHKSTVSRMLRGQQKMTAQEQDKVAVFLGVGIEDVAVHRGPARAGFGEGKQDTYVAQSPKEAKMFTEADVVHRDGKRWIEGRDGGLIPLHPIFGCMKGTMLIPDDLDLTAPADPDWGKVYEDD